jgi:hypothetical protein
MDIVWFFGHLNIPGNTCIKLTVENGKENKQHARTNIIVFHVGPVGVKLAKLTRYQYSVCSYVYVQSLPVCADLTMSNE